MVLQVFKSSAEQSGVSFADPRDEHSALNLNQLCRDFGDLLRRFALAENDLGKSTPESAVSVHLRKTKVRDWCCLKRLEDFVATHAAGSKLFQQLNGFRCGHGAKMPQPASRVTQENCGRIVAVDVRRLRSTPREPRNRVGQSAWWVRDINGLPSLALSPGRGEGELELRAFQARVCSHLTSTATWTAGATLARARIDIDV